MDMQTEWGRVLAHSANEYCHLIDGLDQVNGEWLDNLSSLLPRIHAAISVVRENAIEHCPHDSEIDLELRFELYTRLRKLLGDHDRYALDFDVPESMDGVSGSLADDFTDIYFELKKGLAMLDDPSSDLSRAIDIWYGGYLWHWGQHLVDAEKHLYDLQVHRRLGCHEFL